MIREFVCKGDDTAVCGTKYHAQDKLGFTQIDQSVLSLVITIN